jgi:hypothetical protein
VQLDPHERRISVRGRVDDEHVEVLEPVDKAFHAA